jgi:hypothetical protein
MLQNLDDQVRDCMQRAADCAEYADQVSDPRERADWLALRRRYLALARGIETTRRHGPPAGAKRQTGRDYDIAVVY